MKRHLTRCQASSHSASQLGSIRSSGGDGSIQRARSALAQWTLNFAAPTLHATSPAPPLPPPPPTVSSAPTPNPHPGLTHPHLNQVLYFNTILNKSHEYGTSPYHWYFTSALPRATLAALPLSIAAPFLVPRSRALVAIPLLFVAIYSILPHKELRFVLYAVPPLNAAAAAALARLHNMLPPVFTPSAPRTQQRSKPAATTGRLLVSAALKVGVTIALVASSAASFTFFSAARDNYPGAAALAHVHGLAGARVASRSSRALSVHIGVDAAMSGVSRFLEEPPPWRYSKAEGLGPSEYRKFNYVLAAPGTQLPGFTTIHVQHGFDRVSLSKPPLLRTAPKVIVLQRQAERGAGASSGTDDFADL